MDKVKKFKNTLKKHSRRILPFFIITVLLMSYIVFPASAADPGFVKQDLLIALNGYLGSNGMEELDEVDPVFYLYGNYLDVYWNPVGSNQIYDYVLLNIQSDVAINSIKLNGAIGQLSGFYDGLYQFRFYINSAIYSDLSIEINHEENYDGYVAIMSCEGVTVTGHSIPHANVYRQNHYIVTSEGRVTAEVEDLSGSSHVYFPVENLNIQSSALLSNKTWNYTTILCDIKPYAYEFENLDSIKFVVASLDLIAPGISLYDDGSWTPSDVVPLTINEVAVTQYAYSNVPSIINEFMVNYYVIEADLSGYDLTNKTISLSYRTTPSSRGPDYPGQFTWSSIVSCDVVVQSESTGFLGSLFSFLGEYFNYFKRLLGFIDSSVDRANREIKNELQDNNEAILNGGDKEESINSSSDQINSGLTEAEEDLAVIEQITIPELDINVQLGQYLDYDSNAINILSSLVSSSFVQQLLLISLLFALLGFMIFGRR